MDFRKELGNAGEDKACEFLKKRGYKILERNFRCRSGEIDIIARDGDVIVFVEVKTRRSDQCGDPEESVICFKQKKIIKAAQFYLYIRDMTNIDCRFDVVAVKLGAGEEIEVFEDAFSQ